MACTVPHCPIIQDAQDPAVHDFPLQKHVAVNTELVDKSQILIHWLNSQPPRMADRPELNFFALEVKLAAIRLVESGQDFHQRRFASAVIAQKAQNFTLAELDGGIP